MDQTHLTYNEQPVHLLSVVERSQLVQPRWLEKIYDWAEYAISCEREPKWKNYQRHNLNIESHLAFAIAIAEDETILGFHGISNGGRYPEGAYRLLNRCYTNPSFRHQRLHIEHLFPFLWNKHADLIDLAFVSRQEPGSLDYLKRIARRLSHFTQRPWQAQKGLVKVVELYRDYNWKTNFQRVIFSDLNHALVAEFPQISVSDYHTLPEYPLYRE